MTKKYESRTRYVIHGAMNVVVAAAVDSSPIHFTRNTSAIARRKNRKTEMRWNGNEHKQTTKRQQHLQFFTHLDPIIFLDDSPSYSSLLSVAVAANVGDDGGGSVVDDVCVARIDNGHKIVSAAAINNSVVCILFRIFCSP